MTFQKTFRADFQMKCEASTGVTMRSTQRDKESITRLNVFSKNKKTGINSNGMLCNVTSPGNCHQKKKKRKSDKLCESTEPNDTTKCNVQSWMGPQDRKGMLGTEKGRREGEGKRQKGLGMENSRQLYRNYRFLCTPKTDPKMFCFLTNFN